MRLAGLLGPGKVKRLTGVAAAVDLFPRVIKSRPTNCGSPAPPTSHPRAKITAARWWTRLRLTDRARAALREPTRFRLPLTPAGITTSEAGQVALGRPGVDTRVAWDPATLTKVPGSRRFFEIPGNGAKTFSCVRGLATRRVRYGLRPEGEVDAVRPAGWLMCDHAPLSAAGCDRPSERV